MKPIPPSAAPSILLPHQRQKILDLLLHSRARRHIQLSIIDRRTARLPSRIAPRAPPQDGWGKDPKNFHATPLATSITYFIAGIAHFGTSIPSAGYRSNLNSATGTTIVNWRLYRPRSGVYCPCTASGRSLRFLKCADKQLRPSGW